MDSTKVDESTAVNIPPNESPPESERLPSNGQGEKSRQEEKTRGRYPLIKCLCSNLLIVTTLLGVVVGVALGIGLRSIRKWTKREVMYVNFPGELMLNMLKGLILPLIVSSLVAAVGCLDVKLSGRIGLRAIVYYIITTILAIILGIILVTTIKPGVSYRESLSSHEEIEEVKQTLPVDTLMDLLRHLFPPNIIEATLITHNTVLKNFNNTENATEDEMKEWDVGSERVHHSNILGVVSFSIVLGITLAYMEEKGKPLLDIFVTFSNATMIITKVVIWLTPIGILFLVASKIMEMEDLGLIAGQIGMYTVTVLCGIMVHGFIVLPLIYFVMVRKNPFWFIINMSQALATAFGTGSSSATLPVTIICLEEHNFVDPRVARFVLPIGATINMDGTALYEAVAAIFIAQVRGVSLNAGKIIAISITATAASIGAAGIPQAGLVTMVMVLNVVGLPVEDISLILIVDWALDRFRTLINVLGDAFGAAIVEHFSQSDLVEHVDVAHSLKTANI